MYNVGDVVKVTGNNGWLEHGFEIGEVVTVICEVDEDDDLRCCNKNGMPQFICVRDVEAV